MIFTLASGYKVVYYLDWFNPSIPSMLSVPFQSLSLFTSSQANTSSSLNFIYIVWNWKHELLNLYVTCIGKIFFKVFAEILILSIINWHRDKYTQYNFAFNHFC